jgi:hypothetical protein
MTNKDEIEITDGDNKRVVNTDLAKAYYKIGWTPVKTNTVNENEDIKLNSKENE